jgi:hypothetical protein
LLSLIRVFRPQKKIPYLLLLLGFSLLPVISVFREGSYESGDMNIHIARTMSFYKALEEGIIIPRWAGELNATYGYALFNFFYPLPYYISSFYHLIGFSFLDSVKLLLITSYISSGLFMYLWLKNHVFEKSAFLGSIFYLFAPYHLVDMHFRATVGEMTAFTLLPLSLLLVDKVFKHRKFIWCFFSGLSCAFLILSHAGIALFGYSFLTLYILSYFKNTKVIDSVKGFVPLILGVLYSAYYWTPAVIESNLTHQLISEKTLSFIRFSELLYSKWRYGLLFQGPRGELSFLLGYAHWITILLAIYLIFIKKVKNKNLIIFTFLTLIYLFLIQDISKPVWNNITILKKMLLTYRLLVIISLITSALAAFVINYQKEKRLYYFLLAIAIGTTILNWGNRKNTPEIKDEQITANLPLITIQGEGAWNAVSTSRPINQLWQDKIPKNHIEAFNNNLDVLFEKRTTTNHSYVVEIEKSGPVKENTYYFPGWELKIDGEKSKINYTNKLYPGIITFNLYKGTHQINLTFQDTPIRLYSFLLSAVSLYACGLFLLFGSKQYTD